MTDSHFHDWDNPSFSAINAGCSADDLPQRMAIYGKYDFIYMAAAMGPWEVKDRTQSDIDAQFEILKANIQKYNPLFIGEIGLDYHWDYGPSEVQIPLFKRQMELADSLGKRVLIHCRDAYEDVCRIIEETSPSMAGVIHCCDGSPKLIETALKHGFWISFAGNLTYKSNEHLREAIKTVPRNKLLLETDSPYLAPVPFRGKKNSPDLIVNTYKTASEVLGVPLDELTALVDSNFRAFCSH